VEISSESSPLRAALQRARLYGIVDLGYVTAENAPGVTQRMLDGGVQVIQLRAKTLPASEIAALARKLVPLCRAAGVPFLLNDHPALVPETGADGAHVGQDDLSVAEARTLTGPGKLVGKSTHSLAQAEAAQAEGPDYIGFGPLFATPTKPDYTPIGIQDIISVHTRVSVPIFCIGGVKRENLPELTSAGARRVVIVSGILQAPDIAAYCRDCLATLRPSESH
jgi:thiamine-phosphate pyrophosphorylase